MAATLKLLCKFGLITIPITIRNLTKSKVRVELLLKPASDSTSAPCSTEILRNLIPAQVICLVYSAICELLSCSLNNAPKRLLARKQQVAQRREPKPRADSGILTSCLQCRAFFLIALLVRAFVSRFVNKNYVRVVVLDQMTLSPFKYNLFSRCVNFSRRFLLGLSFDSFGSMHEIVAAALNRGAIAFDRYRIIAQACKKVPGIFMRSVFICGSTTLGFYLKAVFGQAENNNLGKTDAGGIQLVYPLGFIFSKSSLSKILFRGIGVLEYAEDSLLHRTQKRFRKSNPFGGCGNSGIHKDCAFMGVAFSLSAMGHDKNSASLPPY